MKKIMEGSGLLLGQVISHVGGMLSQICSEDIIFDESDGGFYQGEKKLIDITQVFKVTDNECRVVNLDELKLLLNA